MSPLKRGQEENPQRKKKNQEKNGLMIGNLGNLRLGKSLRKVKSRTRDFFVERSSEGEELVVGQTSWGFAGLPQTIELPHQGRFPQ